MIGQISVQLYWENHHEDINSFDGLSEVIKKLEFQAIEHLFVGTLCRNSECLSIGFGAFKVPMMYFSEKNTKILYSLGDELKETESDEDVVFFYQGSWSRFGKRTVVPYDLAVEAFKEFYLTGNRTDKVKWQHNRYVT